jgi:hypothetical protein
MVHHVEAVLDDTATFIPFSLAHPLSLSHMQTGVVAALGGPATLGGEEQRGGTQRAPDEAVPPARGPDDAWRSEQHHVFSAANIRDGDRTWRVLPRSPRMAA